MGKKADEFRAQARRLEERAGTVIDEKVRLALLSVAGRWRGLAQDADRYEMDATRRPTSGSERQNRKVVIAALSRAVRIYWEHEKVGPLPDFLAKLAAAADDACSANAAIPASNARPGEGGGRGTI